MPPQDDPWAALDKLAAKKAPAQAPDSPPQKDPWAALDRLAGRQQAPAQGSDSPLLDVKAPDLILGHGATKILQDLQDALAQPGTGAIKMEDLPPGLLAEHLGAKMTAEDYDKFVAPGEAQRVAEAEGQRLTGGLGYGLKAGAHAVGEQSRQAAARIMSSPWSPLRWAAEGIQALGGFTPEQRKASWADFQKRAQPRWMPPPSGLGGKLMAVAPPLAANLALLNAGGAGLKALGLDPRVASAATFAGASWAQDPSWDALKKGALSGAAFAAVPPAVFPQTAVGQYAGGALSLGLFQGGAAAIEGQDASEIAQAAGGGTLLGLAMGAPSALRAVRQYMHLGYHPALRRMRMKPKQATVEAIAEATPSRAEMSDWLQRVFGTRIGIGKAFRGRKALAYYTVGSAGIRERSAHDITTDIHEIGHLLYERTFPDSRTARGGLSQRVKALTPYRAELKKLDYAYPKRKRVTEGFAEALRLFVENPKSLATRAPAFAKFFQDDLLQRPEYAPLGMAQKMMQRFNGVPGAVRARVIGRPPPAPSPEERLGNAWAATVRRVQNDQVHFEQLSRAAAAKLGRDLPPETDPATRARLALGSSEAAMQDILHGVQSVSRPWSGRHPGGAPKANRLSRGIPAIMQGMKGKQVKAFADALRASEIIKELGRHRITNPADQVRAWGLSAADAKAAVTAYEASYGDFAGRRALYMEHRNALLDLRVEAGLMTPEQYANIRKQHPGGTVPLERNAPEFRSGGNVPRRYAGLWSMVHQRKGSARPIRDPIEVLVEETARVRRLVNKHMVDEAVVSTAKLLGGGGLVQKVQRPMAHTQTDIGRMRKQLSALGIDTRAIADSEVVHIFSQSTSPGRGNIVSVREGGKMVDYEIMDPLLANSMHGLDTVMAGDINRWIRAAGLPARTLKLGVTVLNPAFWAIKNPTRDTFTRLVHTHGKAWPTDVVRMTLAATTKAGRADIDQWVEAFFRSGAGLAGIHAGERRPARIRGLEQLAIPRSVAGRARAALGRTADSLRNITGAPEQATRLAEFIRQLPPPGAPVTHGQIMKGAMAARDVSVDFGLGGSLGRQINAVTAFFNPAIQGPTRTLKALKDNPRGFFIASSVISVAAATTYAVAQLDPEGRYDKLPYHVTDSNLVVTIPKGPMVAIPLPFEIGIVSGGYVRRALDWLRDNDPDAWKGAMGNLLRSAYPGLTPTAVNAFLENAQNRNWYGGRIVPESKEKLPGPLQTTARTTSVAREIAETMHSIGMQDMIAGADSPAQIEHVVRSWFGRPGIGALQLLDRALGHAPLRTGGESRLIEVPVLGQFIVREKRVEKPLRRLYGLLRQIEQHSDAWRVLMKEDLARANAYYEQHEPRIREHRLASTALRHLSILRRAHEDAKTPKLREATLDAMNLFGRFWLGVLQQKRGVEKERAIEALKKQAIETLPSGGGAATLGETPK